MNELISKSLEILFQKTLEKYEGYNCQLVPIEELGLQFITMEFLHQHLQLIDEESCLKEMQEIIDNWYHPEPYSVMGYLVGAEVVYSKSEYVQANLKFQLDALKDEVSKLKPYELDHLIEKLKEQSNKEWIDFNKQEFERKSREPIPELGDLLHPEFEHIAGFNLQLIIDGEEISLEDVIIIPGFNQPDKETFGFELVDDNRSPHFHYSRKDGTSFSIPINKQHSLALILLESLLAEKGCFVLTAGIYINGIDEYFSPGLKPISGEDHSFAILLNRSNYDTGSILKQLNHSGLGLTQRVFDPTNKIFAIKKFRANYLEILENELSEIRLFDLSNGESELGVFSSFTALDKQLGEIIQNLVKIKSEMESELIPVRFAEFKTAFDNLILDYGVDAWFGDIKNGLNVINKPVNGLNTASHRLPYPLAAIVNRLINIPNRIDDIYSTYNMHDRPEYNKEKYEILLELGETVMAFMGIITASIVFALENHDGSLKSLISPRKDIDYKRMTLFHFQNMFRSARKILIKRINANAQPYKRIPKQFVDLLSSKEFDKRLDGFRESRNRYAHTSSKEYIVQEAFVEDYKNVLQVIDQLCKGLVGYKILKRQDLKTTNKGRSFVHKMDVLEGFRIPFDNWEYANDSPMTDDLYSTFDYRDPSAHSFFRGVFGREARLKHSLTLPILPLLYYRIDPTDKQPAIYFYNRLEGKDAVYVSYLHQLAELRIPASDSSLLELIE